MAIVCFEYIFLDNTYAINKMYEYQKKEVEKLKHFSKRLLACMLCLCLSISTLTGCDISSKHLEVTYEENDNEDIVGWDNAENNDVSDWNDASVVTTWDDVDDYSEWIYSQILFDDMAEEFPVVECKVLDYKSNGKYFDGDKVYTMVGDKFDANSFVAKYAIGTGVIVICVVLTVATAGGSSPVVCFIAGAADGAVSYAVKGAAFSAATKAVVAAIKSEGDIEQTFYGALEGSADGYMWGAMYGALTGGLNSTYCFTEDTVILTENGLVCIADIQVGDYVYAYDEDAETYAYKQVTQVVENSTLETVKISINGEIIESTYAHPYYTSEGWLAAGELKAGDYILSADGDYIAVDDIEISYYESPVNTYNLCIEDYHSFAVGTSSLIVHNRCNLNSKYANDRYKFAEGSVQAEKYPNGVFFSQDAEGKVWPRFEEYAKATAKFDFPSTEAVKNGTCLVGNCSSDFAMANAQCGFTSTPAGYTWHHVEDAQTMLLVPQDIHSVVFGGVAHTGGESVIAAILSAL